MKKQLTLLWTSFMFIYFSKLISFFGLPKCSLTYPKIIYHIVCPMLKSSFLSCPNKIFMDFFPTCLPSVPTYEQGYLLTYLGHLATNPSRLLTYLSTYLSIYLPPHPSHTCLPTHLVNQVHIAKFPSAHWKLSMCTLASFQIHKCKLPSFQVHVAMFLGAQCQVSKCTSFQIHVSKLASFFQETSYHSQNFVRKKTSIIIFFLFFPVDIIFFKKFHVKKHFLDENFQVQWTFGFIFSWTQRLSQSAL